MTIATALLLRAKPLRRAGTSRLSGPALWLSLWLVAAPTQAQAPDLAETGNTESTTPAQPPAAGSAEAAAEEDAAPPVEPERPQYASRAERDQHLLANRFPDETRWLSLPEGDVLALYRPAMASPKGVLLMFRSSEQPPHWSPELGNLRQALPRHGWATFAVTLPLPTPEAVPPRPEPQPEPQPENTVESTTETEIDVQPLPLPPRDERIADRVNAALQWLARNGQGNLVVLVEPLAAEAVMATLQPQLADSVRDDPPDNGESPLSGPIRALIVVNHPSAHHPLDNDALTALFSIPELPVLDVFVGHSDMARTQARRHRDIAKRQQLSHYQRFIIGRPDVHDLQSTDSTWVRRIQGFMQRQAEGREVRLRPSERPRDAEGDRP
ncbi:DUF3530 family protein [Marinimicrobium sp. ARAG 43.8]|uniref:DUF3530 family protein n=1 Tax=Marinimicrobium sp. ARAG 43.8 TaxID=3418719 RepID=UPI003CF711DD